MQGILLEPLAKLQLVQWVLQIWMLWVLIVFTQMVYLLMLQQLRVLLLMLYQSQITGMKKMQMRYFLQHLQMMLPWLMVKYMFSHVRDQIIMRKLVMRMIQ